MKELDIDGDGKLDLKEFSEFIRQVLAGTVGQSKELDHSEDSSKEEAKKDIPLPVPETVPEFTMDTPVIKKDQIIEVPELSVPIVKESPKNKSSSSSSKSSKKSKSKSHSSKSVSSKSSNDSNDKIAKDLQISID